MKKMIQALCVLFVLCAGFVQAQDYVGSEVAAAEEVFARKVAEHGGLRNLAEFDGLRNKVYGPFGIPVSDAYFTKDMSYYLESGEVYHATFEPDVRNMSAPVLVLRTPLIDCNAVPLVISVSLPDRGFKNYIVKFGEKPELMINLRKAGEAECPDSEKRCLTHRCRKYRVCLVGKCHQRFPF